MKIRVQYNCDENARPIQLWANIQLYSAGTYKIKKTMPRNQQGVHKNCSLLLATTWLHYKRTCSVDTFKTGQCDLYYFYSYSSVALKMGQVERVKLDRSYRHAVSKCRFRETPTAMRLFSDAGNALIIFPDCTLKLPCSWLLQCYM